MERQRKTVSQNFWKDGQTRKSYNQDHYQWSIAKAVGREVIDVNYSNIDEILNKYDLNDKFHRIFTIDETGI